MKSFFKLLEKTAGPIGLLTATAGAILDFLTPLGNYIYVLAAILLLLTVLSAICSKSNPMLQKVKNSTTFAPDFIKNELVELWQPDGVAFWKKGLFQVLTFLTALCLCAGVYAKDNPNGFLATKIDSIASLQTNLGLIDSKLGNISAKQDKIIEVIEKTDKKIDLVKKETSDNPRKELANLGVEWSYEQFRQSVISNDKQLVLLFIQGGMKIKKQDMQNFFSGDFFDKDFNQSISQNKTFLNCPDMVIKSEDMFKNNYDGEFTLIVDSIDFKVLYEASKSEEKLNLLRSTCDVKTLMGTLNKVKDLLMKRSAQNKLFNDNLEKEKLMCVSGLINKDNFGLYTETTSIPLPDRLLNHNILTPRESFLAKLSVDLTANGYDMNSVFDKKNIQEKAKSTCEEYITRREIFDEKVEGVNNFV